jgi:hypothetical protein
MKTNKVIYIICLTIGLVFSNSLSSLSATPDKHHILKKDTVVTAVDSCIIDTLNYKYLSSKVHLVLPANMLGISLKGTMKMVKDDRIQLSIVMPIFGTELVKLDITPNEMLLIDRHDKMYVQANKQEMMKYLPKGSDYSQLEELLISASQPNGRSEVSGSDFGLKSLKDARVQLYDFSTEQLVLQPSVAPTKYKKVTLDEFVKALKGLQ